MRQWHFRRGGEGDARGERNIKGRSMREDTSWCPNIKYSTSIIY